MEKVFFGIDLGTTNSVISFAQVSNGLLSATPMDIERVVNVSHTTIDGKTKYNLGRSKILPSYVYYDNNNKPIIGDYAKEQYKRYPDRVAKSIKSQMGNRATRGLDVTIPDTTPEEISARILEHLKKAGQNFARQMIEDVIITVPANFDAARREATMIAAEKAGFNVRKEDGSWKAILISEPNAVLYDLAQKIINNQIPRNVLNFDEKKKVLVFDIGGGTLDVTLHEIENNPETVGVLDIYEVAASRYTQLAGDDFDERIAEHLYTRCIEKLRVHDPAAVLSVQNRQATVKKMLTVAAEQLKINMNSGVSSASFGSIDSWFGDEDEAEEETDPAYDISHPIGGERTYNDTIKQSEFEAMLKPFLGEEYKYEDYRGYSTNKKISKNNIIAPILDVLEKAARHYERKGEELKVDAVVLNGGMSNLYLIKNRIAEFFGLDPITISDPDLSVANGAATFAAISAVTGIRHRITIKRYVQNDNLYLGLSAGANSLLVSDGDELPANKVIDGYRLIPGTRNVEIPIKSGTGNGEPQTIARGMIEFPKPARATDSLRIEATVDQSRLVSIKASLTNEQGELYTSGSATIALGENMDRRQGGERIIPYSGATVIAANEINALKNLYSSRNRSKNRPQQIETRMNTILNCGNPEDFEDVVFRHLSENNELAFRVKLYTIAFALISKWSANSVQQLRELSRRDVINGDGYYTTDERKKRLSDYIKEGLSVL